MRETLYIRLGAGAHGGDTPGADTPGEALWREPGGAAGGIRSGPLTEAIARAATCRVVVAVPGESVGLLRARIPTAQRQRMLRAVPYALEEQLAEDVEGLHFALGAHDPVRGTAVAVTARARMDAWLESLRGAGIQADALVPDSLLLPWEPGTWTGLVEPHRVILRTGAQDGLAGDPDNLVALLELALREADGTADADAGAGKEASATPEAPAAGGPPQRIRLFLGAAVEPPAGLEGLPVPVAIEEAPEGILGLLTDAVAENDPARRAISLLQGPYSRREQLGRLWRPWRATAALLAAWLLVGAGLQIYQYFDLRARTAAGAREIVALYRRTFPGERRVVNARVQMEHHLEALLRRRGAAEGGFLALLTKIGTAMEAAPGVTLQALDYRDGGLDLRVAAKDMPGLDRMRAALAAAGGLNVDLQSASTSGERVEGRIRIRSRGS